MRCKTKSKQKISWTQTRLLAAGSKSWKEAKESWLMGEQTSIGNNETIFL